MTAPSTEAQRITDRCTYNPWDLADMPLGAHRCPVCGCVVIAGFVHGPCTDIRCPHADKGESGRLMQSVIAEAEEASGEPPGDWFREALVGVRLAVSDSSHPLMSCLRQIEWQLNRKGWCPEGVDYFPTVHALSRVGHRLSSRDIRVPAALWKAHSGPDEALDTIRRICEKEADVFRRYLSPKCVGIAFSTEAWTVARPISDTREVRPLSAPDRVEERNVYGILVDGTFGQIGRPRGGEPESADAVSGATFDKVIALGEWLRSVQDA